VHSNTPMGVTAENLANKYNISCEECGEFVIRSHQLWFAANNAGVFHAKMAPIKTTTKKDTTIVDTNKHPRPSMLLEKLATLHPAFDKDGVVTATNSFGICDGAGSIIVASEQATVRSLHLASRTLVRAQICS
jgi:acetyl-CoA acyltransferase 2